MPDHAESRLGRIWGRRHSLVIKAVLLFIAVSALLTVEVILGLQLGKQMEKAADDLSSIDRRGQSLLLSASKINDMLYDLTVVEFSPRDANPAMLAHLHSHIVALTPIEREIRLAQRAMTGLTVGDLLARSSEVQVNPTPLAAQSFAHDIRPTIEELSGEALKILVGVEEERKAMAVWVDETRRQFWRIMVAIGCGGALVISAIGLLFFVNLVRALREIRSRANLIADGDYTGLLSTKRADELGSLMRAVNGLSQSLADRDKQLDELRGRFAHQEKMLALGMFATGMAHEIGNPIQAISALAEQVAGSLEEEGANADIAANIASIHAISAQADRLTRTVRDIREFAHPGKAELEDVDVNEVVRTTANLMRFDPRFRRGRLDVECQAENSVVRAVADHLVQVVMNLLVNAADAVDEGAGSIRISTRDDGDRVHVEVEDTGSGMAPDVLQKAREPFFTTKPRNKGTGLGLSICRSIIEEHRGSMHIVSEPGKGTTVTLAIPRGQS